MTPVLCLVCVMICQGCSWLPISKALVLAITTSMGYLTAGTHAHTSIHRMKLISSTPAELFFFIRNSLTAC